jgi:biofilm PGA synthesis N-glycosyltransferase PgaC
MITTTEFPRYVIITPVRDEEANLNATIESVIRQTVLPDEWVLVNDGSTDGTGKIIDHYAETFPWIRAIHRPNRGFRKPGSGVMEAFYEGYNSRERPSSSLSAKLNLASEAAACIT